MKKRSASQPSVALSQAADQELIHRAMRNIMTYLTDYPRARDTLRGIAEWWADTTTLATEEALRTLVDHGFLVSTEHNSQVLFGRNPDFSPAELEHLQSLIETEPS